MLVSLNPSLLDAEAEVGFRALGNTKASLHLGHRTRAPCNLTSPRTRCPLGQLHVILDVFSFIAFPPIHLEAAGTKS